jgi:hypothetical protein
LSPGEAAGHEQVRRPLLAYVAHPRRARAVICHMKSLVHGSSRSARAGRPTSWLWRSRTSRTHDLGGTDR